MGTGPAVIYDGKLTFVEGLICLQICWEGIRAKTVWWYIYSNFSTFGLFWARMMQMKHIPAEKSYQLQLKASRIFHK